MARKCRVGDTTSFPSTVDEYTMGEMVATIYQETL